MNRPATRPSLEPVVHDPGTTCTAMSDILNRIGDKWSVMIVANLGNAPTMRFSELRRAVDGISQRMLTLTLRNLERDGLVHRTIYAQVPPRVEYKLTALGETLLEPIYALWDWAGAHGEDVAQARERYDSTAAG
jgi:DNA-binding HxlR family transcriptional regulator